MKNNDRTSHNVSGDGSTARSSTHRRLYWQVPFLMFLIAGTLYIAHQQRNMPYHHDTGFIFGTVYNITYQCDSNMKNSIEAELKKVDRSLSTFNPTSTISRINRSEDVKADKMFIEVFQLAQQVSEDTQGAFDITVAPLVNAWGFGFKQGIYPSEQSIDSLKPLIGYHRVTCNKSGAIQKEDPRIMLDCSAIAKGYGCDVVARLLRANGIKNFMVEIGGEVVTNGYNEKNTPWRIGITKPTDDSVHIQQELQTVLHITNQAMATSGNYRNFYYKGGKKYAHTIDPHTGHPVQHSLLSATVLARNCATADAYATAFMVMGAENARSILTKHPELMAYFIYSTPEGKNGVWYSPALKKHIVE